MNDKMRQALENVIREEFGYSSIDQASEMRVARFALQILGVVERHTPMSSETVSDPSAGPRDRFNALAAEVVGGMPISPPDRHLAGTILVKALKDVYWEGHREGVSSAKAEWGEAVTDTDHDRAYRFIEVLVDDEDIVVRGDRTAIEARLRDEFAEVRAVALAGVLSKRASNPFNEELEMHRERIEAYLKLDGAMGEAMRALWFLLAVAHQP